jgi:ribosome-binding factor A
MGRRTERLSAQILKEVSGILSFMKDPRLGFLTLHRVDLTDDLSVAKIFVSTMGDDAEVKSTWIALERSAGHVRTALGKTLNIRYVPELRFIHDKNLDHSYKINELLSQVKKDVAGPLPEPENIKASHPVDLSKFADEEE